MAKPGNLKVVVDFPERDLRDVVATLRRLAAEIEKGEYGKVKNMAWVIDGEKDRHVGLLGETAFPASTAYYLFGVGMRQLEDVERG